MNMPHSPEAEAGLIAKLLVDPSLIPNLVGRLNADDFHDETYGKAWAVMEANAGDARRVDANTLKAGGVDVGDVYEFINRATSAPVEEYAAIVTLLATKRRTLMSLESAKRKVRDGKDETEVFGAVQQAVTDVLSQHRGGGLFSLADAVEDYDPGSGGISWGLSALDRVITPPAPSDMVVIAARPNVGKSLVSMEMALSMSLGSQHPVMFTTIEMSRNQLVKRLAHRAGGLDQFKQDYNLVIHDEPRATTATVRAAAARLRVQHGGIKAIFIDYLQILCDTGEPDHVRVSRISRECKSIAREFNVPVVVMSQLNRQSESREDRRPKLADLRDSGAIEQDADIVLGLYRQRLNAPEMLAGCLKHRHGKAGDWVELWFDMEHVSVDEG